ncbi:MAG: MBL fold metallo-hydrolase [Ruminococcaceae bacterium]|nr:MBL fold metallo-hydrolase [Oscillospiraceae bacterium]
MKRLLVKVLVFTLVLCNLFTHISCNANLAGDVNSDGKISTVDYFIIKKYVLGVKELTNNQLSRADSDGDGKIDQADFIALKPIPQDNSSATIYQLSTSDDALMMSYLIVTGNGNVIMIDGGMTGSSSYNILYNQLKRYGKIKDRDNVVDAWIFTHPHNDHVKAFCYIWQQHPELEIKNFYYNFPTEQEILAMPKEEHVYTEDLAFFINTFNKNKESDTAFDEYPEVQEGDSFTIDGVKFEILQTYESWSSLCKNVDDSSMVVKMTAGGQSVLFLGDLREDGGKILLEKYSDELKSDIVQMSRHGQNGVEKEVYEAINPQICLWPTPLWVWESNVSTKEIKGWMQDIGVKYHNTMREGWMDEKYNSLNLSENSIAIPCEYVVK